MGQLSQLFVEAGTLLLAGMIFVFVFLGLLVVFINMVLVKLAVRFPDKVVVKSPQRPVKKQEPAISPSIVAAISSAVSQYRKQHQNTK